MAGRLLTYIDSVEDMLNDLENAMNESWVDWFIIPAFEWGHFVDDKLFVEVKKGRLWKGSGYAVGYYEEQYYNWIQRKVKVYDPIANEIHLVSAENVTLHPIYKEEFKAHMQMIIKEHFKATPEDMWRGFGMDHQKYFKNYLHLRKNFITIPNTVRCPEIEAKLTKRQAKQEEFKKVKMSELIKWAESKGKVGQEAIDLAERVWHQKYFKNYLHLRKNFITIPNTVRCPEIEAKLTKRQAKQEEFKKVKMSELIKWAESKGKVGQEAIDLAERVWQKNYA